MGGAQYQIKCLLDYLGTMGRYDIHYLARRVPDERTLDGYSIHQIAGGGPMPRFGYLGDARALSRILSRLRPDVIYQRVGCAYTGICAHHALRHRARLVWHAASDADLSRDIRVADRNFIRARLESAALAYGIRRAHRIVVQTERQARSLAQNYGRRADAVIANFHPAPDEVREADDPPRIVWIANFKQLKQPEAFIRLAEQLQGLAGVRFVMIGAPAKGGDEGAWSDALIRRIAASPNLSYLGQLDQAEVNAQLLGAYAFVNTSLYEGFPNTFVQAWLRGVPVVSLHVNPDGIFDGETVGCHAGSDERMAAIVRHLVENPDVRDRMSRNARQHALRFHSMENAARLARIFDEEIGTLHA